MVGKRVVCSHRPGICGDIVNLDMKIGADGASCDAIDFTVEINRGVEVGRDSIRWQARVISIADRVVAPKRGSRSEVLVDAAKQVDVSAVSRGAEPATRLRKGGDGRPGVGPGRVFISVCDGSVIGDAAETINVAALRGYGVSRDGDGIGSLLHPRADRSAWRRGGGRRGSGGVNPGVQIACTRTNGRLRICLTTASPSRSGRGEHRGKQSNKGDYQAN